LRGSQTIQSSAGSVCGSEAMMINDRIFEELEFNFHF
jgi:hypothetical protein